MMHEEMRQSRELAVQASDMVILLNCLSPQRGDLAERNVEPFVQRTIAGVLQPLGVNSAKRTVIVVPFERFHVQCDPFDNPEIRGETHLVACVQDFMK
jgi:hypothetical protein